MLPALLSRARRGDGAALCRLYAEYAWCDRQRGNAAALRETIVFQQRRRARASTVQERAEIDDMLRDLQTAAAHDAGAEYCRDVAIPNADERLRDLRRAALAGHLPATSLYARGRGFPETLRQLDAMQVYGGEAERLAVQAARGGDTDSLFALAEAYDPGVDDGHRSLLGEAVRQSAPAALAYYLQLQALFADPARPDLRAARRYVDDRIADLLPLTTAQDRSLARREAAARIASWTPPPPGSLARWERFPLRPDADDDRDICGPDADDADTALLPGAARR